MTGTKTRPLGKLSKSDWPSEVDLILSAQEIGRHASPDRRADQRASFRVRARLRLFSDGPDSAPWPLFTRDLGPRGLGFLSPNRLPLGYGGRVEFRAPDGSQKEVHCTILRCREAAPGWYDCAVYFNREHPEFDAVEVD